MSVYEVKTIEDTIGKIDYVGRGIVAGLTPDGKKAVTAYFISGRSENSRNRVFVYRDDALFTEPFDPSKVVDPSLIIYAAVRKTGDKLIVTNGDQTDTIAKGIENGGDFIGALRTREFEPDAPNFTPRISCEFDFSDGYRYRMSILKSADEAGGACNRFFYEYAPGRRSRSLYKHVRARRKPASHVYRRAETYRDRSRTRKVCRFGLERAR